MDNLEFQVATSEDIDFAYEVLTTTMRAYAVEVFGYWPESDAQAQVERDIREGRSQTIHLGGERIGVMRIDRFVTHFQLDHLYILPEYQRCGIGTHILKSLLEESCEVGLPVRLRLLRSNPVIRLYQRLGFIVTEETAERFFMEASPRG